MSKIFSNVLIGKNAVIEGNCFIGVSPDNSRNNLNQTVIGDNAFIRANTIIYAGVTIGDNFQTGPNVLIREDNIIGNDVVVWHGATLNPKNHINSGSRIHAGCFLEEVTLEKQVFLGPRVIFTNDPHPRIPLSSRECYGGARVGQCSVIGANSTVLPHLSIGHHVLVGAGSVVTSDIANFKVAVGNPARIIKNIKKITCNLNGKIHKPYAHIDTTS